MTAIARWCFHHRRIVLLAWIAAVISLSVAVSLVGTRYTGDFDLPKSDAQRAQALLKRDAPLQSSPPASIVLHAKGDKLLTDPEVIARVDPVFTELRGLPRVQFVSTYYSEGNADRISKDGKIAYANVQMSVPDSGTPIADVQRVMDVARQMESPDLQVEFGGNIIQDAIQPTPGADEGLGVLLAGIVLFIAFGSLITMSLPLVTAIFGLGAAITIIGMLSHVSSIATFAPTLVALLALGVGIDYALFIVSRHQKNLLQGMEIEDSAINAIDTSGRAVIFAGGIVIAALIGLMALNISFITGLALSAAVAILATMVATLSFVPAMLGFIGIKALSKRQRAKLASDERNEDDATKSWWYRWTLRIHRRPVVWAAGATAVLIVLSLPVFSMRLGVADEGNDPPYTTTRKAYDLLQQGFGVGHNAPLMVVTQISSPLDFNRFTNFGDAIAPTPGIALTEGPTISFNGKSAWLTLYPTTSPQDERTTELLKHLRDDVIPPAEEQFGLEVFVGGQAAAFSDFGTVVQRQLPIFMTIVLLLSFVLLMFVFKSLLVPLKAIAMNLLTIGSTFGVLVAVFQWGWAGEVFAGGKGPIESFAPVILFAILFGLSMDYEVFLVSRMREEWERTGNNDEAVALGQAHTGRLITAAALIMVFIFASMMLGSDRIIKLFGVGLTTAILLDALVVRAVLVPAVMYTFGERNWHLPAKLQFLRTSESPRKGKKGTRRK